MPSHRADDPPLRRPRTGRSGRPVSAEAVPAAGPRRRAPGRASHPALTSLSAPQVGIAGVLGIATIAAPISGAMASPAPKAMVNPLQASSAPISAAFPALPGAGGTVVAVNVLPSSGLPSTQTPSLIAAPRTVLVTRASRAGERSVLPGCDGVAKVTDAPNGQLPLSSLCTLWDPKHRLRADAAVAIAKLNVAFKQTFGEDICLTDSYRTLSEQYRLKSLKPGLAATPGTSEHGWALALDLCGGIQKGTGARFQWLHENAIDYGWDNPDWARSGGRGPYEPWHWEYVAGETADQSRPGN